MKSERLIVFLIVSFLTIQSNALSAGTAKGIQGEISMLDLVAQTFQVAKGESPVEEGINLIVLPDTQFSGVGSLSDLREGDEVSVEAELNEKTQLWEARSVALVKVKIRDTAL